MLNKMMKSIIDQDSAEVVICNLEHMIIYMNPAAKEIYKKDGGEKLIGTSLLDCHNARSTKIIKKVVEWFSDSKENNKVHTFYNVKENKDVYMVALRDEDGTLLGYYEKHERRNVDEKNFYDMTINGEKVDINNL